MRDEEQRENKSDNDVLDYDKEDLEDVNTNEVVEDDDEFSLNNFQLPRSSSRVQKKGHQRSKSDQVRFVGLAGYWKLALMFSLSTIDKNLHFSLFNTFAFASVR